jgi:hypothetical protein
VRAVAGPGLVEVFTQSGVADPVKTVLDEPVGPDPGGQFGGRGLLGGQGDGGVDSLGAPGVLLAGLGGDPLGPTGDLDGLGGAGEAEPVGGVGDGDDLQGAFLDPAVCPGRAGVADRDLLPGQRLESLEQSGLVALGADQQVCSAPEQVGDVGGLAVECVLCRPRRYADRALGPGRPVGERARGVGIIRGPPGRR